MRFERILAVPFLLPSSGSLVTSKDVDSLEIAVALLLIEEERKKEDDLASISRFFCPLWVHPLDESKALVFDGSEFSSSKINLQILDFGVPEELRKGDFLSFVSELERYVRRAVSDYQSKPSGVKLRGWLGEDFASELRELLPKVEEWTNLKQFEVIEPSYTINKEFLDESCLEWFPSSTLIQREKQKHEATLEIIDSRIKEAVEQFKAMKSDYKEKEAELKSEAQEKLEAEKEKRDRQISKISESTFDKKMPRPGASLEKLVNKISEHADTVWKMVESKDVYEMLDEIGAFRDAVDELQDLLENLEREYIAYKREVDKFYSDKEREIKRIQEEYQRTEKEIQSELERKLEELASKIDEYEKAVEKAEALREQLITAFHSWKEKTEKAIIEYEEITIPLKRLPSNQSFLIFIPLYVAEYRRKAKKTYGVVSPITITDKNRIVRLKEISKLARNYQEEIEKGRANKNFEEGLRNYNYLLNPQIAQEFSKGMNLLEKRGIIDSNTASRIKNAYDQHFRIKLEESS
jgi:uncharacterized protein YukE